MKAAEMNRAAGSPQVEFYRHIVAELPIGIAVLRLEDAGDPDSWVIVEFNAAGLRLAAAGQEDPAGRKLLEFAPEVRGSELLTACLDALRLKCSAEIPDFAGWGRVPGGRFSIKAFPLGGLLVGLAFENITARRAAEAALAKSNVELAQFAFVASHDLQSPLRKAASFAKQLKLRAGAALDETSRDFLDRMDRSLEGMQTLISSLLELAQVGTSAVAPGDVKLEALAVEVFDELQDEISRSGARAECSSLPVVQGDPHQLRQLLYNLIGNALKFTAPGQAPHVRLRGRTFADGRRELVVEDDGVGFDMKFAERAFQPFQRLHSRKDYAGNGMGLAICRKILDRCGGMISVESSIGHGTRFTVVFPAVSAPEAETPHENASR